MNLRELYEEGGLDEMKRLAKIVGSEAQYLRQCATRWHQRRPSVKLAIKLVDAEPRLTLEDIFRQTE